MKRNRLWTVLLCLILITGLLTGCGGSSGENATAADMAYAVAEETTAAMEAPEMAEQVTSSTGLNDYSDPNAKLIHTVELNAQTREYDSLIASLEDKISALGGYIENREAYNGSEYEQYGTRYSNMTIRIPADRLDEFITHVNENANVVNSNETVENITLQYTDTASRVEALETEQDRLLELLEGAQNMTEILEIEARLSDVNYELTSYASQLRVMDNQVSYATVHLYIDEVEELTPIEEPTVWERIRKGFSNTVEDVCDSAIELFVWLVVNSPRILIFAVIVTGVVLIVKSIGGRRKKRKNSPIPEAPKDENKE